MSKITIKDRVKTLDNVKQILHCMSLFESAGEHELLQTLRELRKLSTDLKDDKPTVEMLTMYTTYIETLLNNVYISAEELLIEARDQAKKWRYATGGSNYDYFYLVSGCITVKGSSGKNYLTLSSSSYQGQGGAQLLMVCNAYGFTDEITLPGYEHCTSINIALTGLAATYFKGERKTVDGVTMAVVKLWPHKIAEKSGKKNTPKEVIADLSKTKKEAAPALIETDLKGHVPLDRVGSQQLQPIT